MLLEFISAAFLGTQLIKEKMESRIPAANWRNQELYRKDQLDPNISPKQLLENISNGKYWMSDTAYEAYQKSEFTYTLSKPVVRPEWDYVLVGMTSYTQDKQDFHFKRACKSIDRCGKVELDKNDTTGSQFTNVKIRAAYEEVLQRIVDHYDGKITIRSLPNKPSILLELKER